MLIVKNNKIILFIASSKGYEGIARLLIDAKADLNIKTNSGWTALDYGKSKLNYQLLN